jgi:hypothetical protein
MARTTEYVGIGFTQGSKNHKQHAIRGNLRNTRYIRRCAFLFSSICFMYPEEKKNKLKFNERSTEVTSLDSSRFHIFNGNGTFLSCSEETDYDKLMNEFKINYLMPVH